ncbi:MAG: WD40 repeat domain-containing protein, partial [Pseudonocardiales bacterium]|nr:WD40 repeat domain-containing protein [Pseudonocardiales bacterium]
VTVDEQGRPTRWRVHREELSEPAAAELDAFVARRLLTTDLENGQIVVGVTHEAFLSAWPPLTEAITGASTALRARRQIEQAAAEWANAGHSPDRLWEGGQLAAAVADVGARLRIHSQNVQPRTAPDGMEQEEPQEPTRLALPHPQRQRQPVLGRHRVLIVDRIELSLQARNFLYASIRRERRRRHQTTTILSTLLVAALVAAGLAIIQQRAAEDGRRLATARLLLTRAEGIFPADPQTAIRLGEAAYRMHPDPETRSGLAQLLLDVHQAGSLEGLPSAVTAVAFAPDGRVLATASLDGTVLLWDLTDPAEPRRFGAPLTGHTAAVYSVAFGWDGRTLGTASLDKTALLWDLTDLNRPRQLGAPLTGHTDAVTAAAFAPNGRTLATASSDETVRVWNITDPAHPTPLGPPLTGYTAAVDAVVYAPDGQTLATLSQDGTVLLWGLADPARPRRLGASLSRPTERLLSMALAPDGRILAAVTEHEMILLDLTDPTRPRRIGNPQTTGGTSRVTSVAFGPNGFILAVGREDGNALLWDLTNPGDPRLRGRPLTGHTNAIDSLAFSPDGHTLVTAGRDRTAALWDLSSLDALQGDPLERACSITKGGLDENQWNRYVPDLPYNNPCKP